MGIKEVHRAIVVRNEDDDEGLNLRGAVFFEAKTLFDGEYPLPAMPCFPFASANGAGICCINNSNCSNNCNFNFPKEKKIIKEILINDITVSIFPY